MGTLNDSVTSIAIEYTTAIEMIEKEKTIRLRTVAGVVQRLLNDAQNNSLSLYNEEGEAPYELSIQSKLRTLASFFSNSSLLFEGTSDEFHNLAVDYARNGLYFEACTILERGIALRPFSADLLADYLVYGKNIPTIREKCRKFYKILMDMPRSMWNWRAYSFSIEHLLEERYYTSSQEEETAIKKSATSVAKEYIKRYNKKSSAHKNFAPENIDRAYAALANIYGAFGEHEKEKSTLKSCADKYEKSPVSSMRLADIEFSAGNYADASLYLSKCAATVDPQPSIKQSYVFLLRAHSNASLLFSASTCGNLLSTELKSLISSIKTDLNTSEALLSNSDNDTIYRKSIDTLRRIIEQQYKEEDLDTNEEWS